MSNWVLEDFECGDISCQIIEFYIQGFVYVMLFNRVDAARSEEVISEKAEELGIDYRENSYEVKFDTRANFDSSNFFSKPNETLTSTQVRELGFTIKELLDFHYRNSNAEAYVCVAESQGLKRFYDRLAKSYAEELNFSVRANLGEEGLGYEITTPSYKS